MNNKYQYRLQDNHCGDPLEQERRKQRQEHRESLKPVHKPKKKDNWHVDLRYTMPEIEDIEQRLTKRLQSGEEPEGILGRLNAYRQKLNLRLAGHKSLLKAFNRVEVMARDFGHTS